MLAPRLDERLANALIPPRLYWRIRAWRGWIKGERELRLLPFLVDRRRNSVDAGANKGVYAYHLALLSKHCFAYEPNPKIHAILARSIKGANVTVSNAALSDRAGTAMLNVPLRRGRPSNQTATLRGDVLAGFERLSFEVQTRRLDDEAVGDVGFIKIDVEGAERAVLEGARATIARCKPVLLVEIEEKNTGEKPAHIIAWIESLGYRALCLDRSVLVSASALDLGQVMREGRYIFNFVFLPE